MRHVAGYGVPVRKAVIFRTFPSFQSKNSDFRRTKNDRFFCIDIFSRALRIVSDIDGLLSIPGDLKHDDVAAMLAVENKKRSCWTGPIVIVLSNMAAVTSRAKPGFVLFSLGCL